MVILALVLSGCVIPYRFTPKQGATGIVLDEESGKPIPEANIVVTTHEGIMSTASGSDGHFEIASERQWGIYMIPMDPMPWPWSIRISAKGFQEFYKEETTNIMAHGSREIGEIKLKKEPNHTDSPNGEMP